MESSTPSQVRQLPLSAPAARVGGLALLTSIAVLAATVLMPSHQLVLSALYLIPIGLIAFRFGKWGGGGAALYAIGATVLVALATHHHASFVNLVLSLPAEWVTFVVAGLAIGHLSGRLSELDRWQRVLVDLNPHGIAVIDPRGAVVTVNEPVCKLFGYPRDHMVGGAAGGLVADEHRDFYLQSLSSLIRDPNTQPARLEVTGLKADGTRFPMAVQLSPLIIEGDRLIGCSFDDHSERQMLEEAESARREAERSARHIRVLQQLADAALSHLALDDLLGELINRIGQILDTQMVSFLLFDRDPRFLVLKAASGVPAEKIGERQDPASGLLGEVIAKRHSIVSDVAEPADLREPMLSSLGARSFLGVPLQAGTDLIGVLYVGTLQRRKFAVEEAALLQLAADRVALAITHARLYDQERRIAETLQHGLLPDTLPALYRYQLEARYLPGEGQVGGDWYDAVTLSDGRLAIVMGDVIGHGIGSAAAMGQLRSALRAYLLTDPSPVSVMRRLNDHVRSFAGGQITTLIYLLLNPKTGKIQFSCAGHPPPLLIGADGSAAYRGAGRFPPLGALHDRFVSSELDLTPGSSVLIYTDGLIENRGHSIDEGLERLKTRALEAHGSASELCDHLVKSFKDKIGLDDIALLALRARPLQELRFDREWEATTESVRKARVLISKWVTGLGATPEETYEVSLAVSEACANAIEHGNAEEKFTVKAGFDGGQVRVRVISRGDWQPPQRRLGRGHGVKIMKNYSDDFRLSRSGENVIVDISRELSGGPHTAEADQPLLATAKGAQ